MSRLEDVSVEFRKKNVVRNEYDNNDQYELGHTNAISNGDEKGKGELNGEVGSITDIKTRQKALAKNKFQIGGKEYNAGTVG